MLREEVDTCVVSQHMAWRDRGFAGGTMAVLPTTLLFISTPSVGVSWACVAGAGPRWSQCQNPRGEHGAVQAHTTDRDGRNGESEGCLGTSSPVLAPRAPCAGPVAAAECLMPVCF